MKRHFALLSLFAAAAFAGGTTGADPDTSSDTAMDAVSRTALAPIPSKTTPPSAPEGSLRPGAWGLGVRPFGTTTNLVLYRAVSTRWAEDLRLGWADTRTSQSTPSTSSSSSYQYQYAVAADSGDNRSSSTTASGSATSTTDTRTLTATWFAEYDLPTGQGVDFLAGIGPSASWSWSDASGSSSLLATGGVPVDAASSSDSWTFTGGLRGLLGARWWFVPRRLALVGELEADASLGYTSSRASSNSASLQVLTGTGAVYNYTYATQSSSSSRSNGWTVGTRSYACSAGLDAFF